jgi:hypothetical protein
MQIVLNKYEKQALAFWIGQHIGDSYRDTQLVQNFDDFCNGLIHEWRIMHHFGFAGKLWNANGKIYVSGFSASEISEKDYKDQEEIVDKMNAELQGILDKYGDRRSSEAE